MRAGVEVAVAADERRPLPARQALCPTPVTPAVPTEFLGQVVELAGQAAEAGGVVEKILGAEKEAAVGALRPGGVRWVVSRRAGASVSSDATSVPPTTIEPAAAAIASRMVDLPVPFSPTKKITGAGKVNSPRPRTRGRSNG